MCFCYNYAKFDATKIVKYVCDYIKFIIEEFSKRWQNFTKILANLENTQGNLS